MFKTHFESNVYDSAARKYSIENQLVNSEISQVKPRHHLKLRSLFRKTSSNIPESLKSTHIDISPAILYWGTPVVLVSTTNPNGSINIAPMSSIFWLGHNCMIGLENTSQTTFNIQRTGTCTLNLASDDMKDAVNALARTTAHYPVTESKSARGYTYVQNKFAHANLTPLPSSTSSTPGISECPVIMEAELVAEHSWFKGEPTAGACMSFELHIKKIQVQPELKKEGYKNRIDTAKWKPMIMMFSELYGLRDGRVKESVLASIDEEMYRGFTGTTGE